MRHLVMLNLVRANHLFYFDLIRSFISLKEPFERIPGEKFGENRQVNWAIQHNTYKPRKQQNFKRDNRKGVSVESP